MMGLIDRWIKSYTPCLQLINESSGTYLKEHLIALLSPDGSVRELYIMSDGIGFESLRAPQVYLSSFPSKGPETLIQRLDSYSLTYKNRSEWLENKVSLQKSDILDSWYKAKMSDLFNTMMGLQKGGFGFAHGEFVDNRTLVLYPAFEGQLLDTIFEMRIGITNTITFKKSSFPLRDFIIYLEESLDSVRLVEVS